jgi:hypothetical protein
MRPMMRLVAEIAGLLLAGSLAACQTTGDTPAEAKPAAAKPADPAIAALPAPEIIPEITPAPEPAGALPPPPSPVPHIYMAVQPGSSGRPASAIFAIDIARDNTPSNDQAIRLTPDNGKCNPQEMSSFNFPPEYAAAPVASEADQAKGLTAANLPDFMAVNVTNAMLDRSLANDREETRALNICTRKLWERLILAENQTTTPAGQ